jgi:hypothetical protein
MLYGKPAETVEQWCIFELALKGPEDGNPFRDIELKAVFSHKGRELQPDGFYDGKGMYKIRLMPDMAGIWTYKTNSNCRELDGITGEFNCIKASECNHGPVRVCYTYHFAYEDGTPYYPVGTTCYAWTHQGSELEEQTLKALSQSPFNKLRMCVFPKHYDYNHNEPEYYPFEKASETGWNFERFNPVFFRHLESRIQDLMNLGIEADLILFHPYDRWGFSSMNSHDDDRYLRYIAARMTAYRNIWWSFANEYDLMKGKTLSDWERFANIIVENDPYRHLCSIHNCVHFYDHTRPWITHCSIQRVDKYKTSEMTCEWRQRFRKPVVIDECAYEGNINYGWGNISGMELTRRFWEGIVRGGYVGHGETYMHPTDILWWSKGGRLYGESPSRISFLKKFIEECPGNGIEPMDCCWDIQCGGVPNEYYLFYFGLSQPSFRMFNMPQGLKFKVELIDTWNMTIESLPDVYESDFRINMPGTPYIAVRMQKVLK